MTTVYGYVCPRCSCSGLTIANLTARVRERLALRGVKDFETALVCPNPQCGVLRTELSFDAQCVGKLMDWLRERQPLTQTRRQQLIAAMWPLIEEGRRLQRVARAGGWAQLPAAREQAERLRRLEELVARWQAQTDAEFDAEHERETSSLH